jgi:hypothetical protein
MALPALTTQLLVDGATSQNVKNYMSQLAWQRVTPVVSFPPLTNGNPTLGYPIPNSVAIIYNGAADAYVFSGSLQLYPNCVFRAGCGSQTNARGLVNIPGKFRVRQNSACPLPSSSSTISTTSPSLTIPVSTSSTLVACTSVNLFEGPDFLDIFYCECNDGTWNHWPPGGVSYSSCASQSATRTINIGTSPPASIPSSECTNIVFGPDPPAFGIYFETQCRCGDYYAGSSGCPASISAPTSSLIYSAPSGYPGITFTTATTAAICTDPVAKNDGITCVPSPTTSSPISITPSPTPTPSPSVRTTTLPPTTTTVTIPPSDVSTPPRFRSQQN